MSYKNDNWPFVEIGGLWKKTRPNGTSFYSGKLQNVADIIHLEGNGIFIFNNEKGREKNPRAPHLKICVAKESREQQQEQETDNEGIGQSVSFEDDDIPF